MEICCREVTALFNDTKFCDIATDLTTSEYGPADAGKRAEGDKTFSAFLFSLAYHSRSVITRSAGGKALNHQSQTPLNRGLTVIPHPNRGNT